MNSQKPMKLAEAAEWLGVHPHTLLAKAASGEVPAVKMFHKEWRFIEADLLAWLRGKYQQCHSINKTAQNFGLSISLSKDSGLDEALAPRPRQQRRNTTTR